MDGRRVGASAFHGIRANQVAVCRFYFYRERTPASRAGSRFCLSEGGRKRARQSSSSVSLFEAEFTRLCYTDLDGEARIVADGRKAHQTRGRYELLSLAPGYDGKRSPAVINQIAKLGGERTIYGGRAGEMPSKEKKCGK